MKKFLNVLSKVIGVVTIPPVFAAAMLSALYFIPVPGFDDTLQYVLALFFLAVFPMLAYPPQPLIPGYRGRGREGQRNLAFVMSVTGYSLGILSALLIGHSIGYFSVYLSYFLSGLLLSFVNSRLHIKASGHACGLMGPIVAAIWFIGRSCWFFLLAVPALFWARIRSGRHTFLELVSGAGVSLICTLAALYICSML